MTLPVIGPPTFAIVTSFTQRTAVTALDAYSVATPVVAPANTATILTISFMVAPSHAMRAMRHLRGDACVTAIPPAHGGQKRLRSNPHRLPTPRV